MAYQAIADYELREGEICKLLIDQVEHALLDRALAKCNIVKTRAADFPGINRNTLNKKVDKPDVEAED
jgi:Nif-specific regulatory protein